VDTLLELTSRAEASHFWFRGFRRFVTPLLDRAAAGRTNLRVLDCGCGTGFNLRQLTRYGRAYGMDLSAAGLTLARESHRPLTRADATRIPFASGTFDLVTSFDMLQCVPNDRAAVREIARVLKPGGMFVGTVAALEALSGDHSVLSEEVRRYRRADIERLLRESGFQPLVVRYAFASLFPIVLAARTLQRMRGARATGQEISVPAAPINFALTLLVASEAALAPHVALPFGSSLVFLALRAREGFEGSNPRTAKI
jgi:ubiquinone/menaquinone biosynthesis C-methylase UbiE